MQIYQLAKLARPSHWIKNILIFAAVFFARKAGDPVFLGDTLQMFVAFSLGASAIYVLNDLHDVEQDRLHPVKKNRPIASGHVKEQVAWFFFVALAFVSGVLAYNLSEGAFLTLFFYLIVNMFYSFGLKHIPVVELVLVPVSYVLRVLAGAVVAGVPLSSWIVLCTFFGSLFIISGKRMAEFRRDVRRRVLDSYTKDFLNALVTLSAALTITMYSLYATLSVSGVIPTISIGFVVLGVVRFMYLLFKTDLGEFPERVFFFDRTMQAVSLSWLILMFSAFYA